MSLLQLCNTQIVNLELFPLYSYEDTASINGLLALPVNSTVHCERVLWLFAI